MIKPEVVNQLNAIHQLQLLMHFTKVDSWKHDKYSRTILANNLSIAEITLKVALRVLKNKGFINRISKGVYSVNKDIEQ